MTSERQWARRLGTLATMGALGALASAGPACSRRSDASADAGVGSAASVASSASSAPAASAAASVEPGSDEITPVYPVDAGPPDPLATRLCDVLQVQPEQRKASCCGGSAAVAAVVAGQCTRTLTAALRSHAVTLSQDEVDKCADAMARATTGCDWISSTGGPPLPVECDGIVHGTLGPGARCRSSLECAQGSRCQGLSTIDVGTCAPPKPLGQACNLANDMLAIFARQDGAVDRGHPECAGGYCRAHQCAAGQAPPTGPVCKPACGQGTRCRGGACVAAVKECPVVGVPGGR